VSGGKTTAGRRQVVMMVVKRRGRRYIGPDGETLAAGRAVARRQHLRQEHDAERLGRRHREQKHHRRAVHGEHLVVEFLADEVVPAHRQLGAHQERQHAGHQEEQEGDAEIEDPDDRVVDGGDDPPACRRRPDPLQLLELACRAGRRIGQFPDCLVSHATVPVDAQSRWSR